MEKTADQPHRWTVYLSLVALLISGASFWEAHQARLINAQASQAVLQITGVSAEPSERGFLWNDPSEFFSLDVSLTVTNLGKTGASGIEVRCNAGQVYQKANYNGFERSCFGKLQPLGPGRSYREPMTLLLSPRSFRSGDNTIGGFVIYGNLQYHDAISGENKEEQWCFQTASAFHPGDKRAPEFLPCYDRTLN